MTRIANAPETFKDDMLAGLVAAYPRYLRKIPDASGVLTRDGARQDKVSVVIGGGCGHYPAFSGLVGAGLADGAVVGDIFTSPSAEQAYRVGRAADGGAGVLFSFGNYAGDVLNFGVAQERLRADGIDCRTVLVTDDIASAGPDEPGRRRGIAGTLPVFKAAGAAAARGDGIDEVERVARKANAATRTLGVAFAGCTFPGKSEPLFRVDPGSLEIGLGIHGEPGVRTVAAMPARELADALVRPLLAERPDGAGARAAVLLNGLGATKYEELFVLWKDIHAALSVAGVEFVLPEVGEFVTSLDMAGCSLTLCWLDDELAELWSAPADTPAFRRGEVSTLPVFPPRVGSDGGPEADRRPAEASPEAVAAAGTARAVLRCMLDVVTTHEDELGRIDAVAGDGDHGVGMTRGLRAATQAAETTRGGVGTVLRAAGRAFADQAGGTSGVLWGLLLESVGDTLGDREPPTAARVAAAIGRGSADVARLGRAHVGDKTLLDALVPFTDTLRAAVDAGSSLRAAWSVAAASARQAAEATAELSPKVGRARPLAERSVGTPDPGAVSLALCAEAATTALGDGGPTSGAEQRAVAGSPDAGAKPAVAARVAVRGGVGR